jgi:hypothetical protein
MSDFRRCRLQQRGKGHRGKDRHFFDAASMLAGGKGGRTGGRGGGQALFLIQKACLLAIELPTSVVSSRQQTRSTNYSCRSKVSHQSGGSRTLMVQRGKVRAMWRTGLGDTGRQWRHCQTCQGAGSERRHSASTPSATRRRSIRPVGLKHLTANRLWRPIRSAMFRALPVLSASRSEPPGSPGAAPAHIRVASAPGSRQSRRFSWR